MQRNLMKHQTMGWSRLGHFRWCDRRLSEVTVECDARPSPPTNNMDIDTGPRAHTLTLRATYCGLSIQITCVRSCVGTRSTAHCWLDAMRTLAATTAVTRRARTTSFRFSDNANTTLHRGGGRHTFTNGNESIL